MGDSVHCDVCGNVGRRKRFHFAPDGWFYAEAIDEDNPKSTLIVWACSEDCKKNFWKDGPGKMDLEERIKT